jgi:hypothetical protein
MPRKSGTTTSVVIRQHGGERRPHVAGLEAPEGVKMQ